MRSNTAVDQILQHDRVRQRLAGLRHVANGALAELDLAIFHAHECGMPIEEIARHAEVEVADVHSTIGGLRRDHDQGVIDLDYDDSLTWVQFHQKPL